MFILNLKSNYDRLSGDPTRKKDMKERLTNDDAINTGCAQRVRKVLGEHSQHETMGRYEFFVARDQINIKFTAFGVRISNALVTCIRSSAMLELDCNPFTPIHSVEWFC